MDVNKALKLSDDLENYEEIFQIAAEEAIEKGWFTAHQLFDHGGWVKSTTNPNHYFVSPTCEVDDMVYLDVIGGTIIRKKDM